METITYERIPHIIERQYAAEQAFLAEFEAGSYTLANPLVKLNPYEFCPLTAVVLFETPAASEATITVLGKEAEGNITHRFPASKKHILPIYGLYADYENTVEIVLANGEKSVIKIQTEPLMDGVPLATKMETTKEYMGDNLIFLTAAMRSFPVGYDYKGDLRWYASVNFAFDCKRMPNGHILIGTERLVKMPYFTTGIYEMAFSGKVFKEYANPIGGYHHDQFVMEDGNILMLCFDMFSGTVEDVCVLLDKDTGEVLRKWDYKDVLPQYPTAGSGSQDAHDWFHNNAVWYDKNTNSLTFSARHIDAMCNIDYDSGELNWIIGDPEMWPEEYQKYFFKPVGDGEFDWQYEQHANVILPDGDVMCFDNGHFRSKVPEKRILNKDNFSRGVRYRINTDDMTIRQIWQYGKERGQEFYSQYICNVEYYKEGHYMVHSGGIQYYGEDASEMFAALMKDDPMVRTRSITVEVLDDKKMLELEVEGNFYRAEKLHLYHDGDNLPLGKGERLGKMGVTKEFDTIIEMDSCGEDLPHIYEPWVDEEDDRFTFHAIFESGQLVMLMLEKEDEQHGYFISTAKNMFAALCCGTFIEKDARKVTCSINKAGLNGTYDLRMIVDDKKYETGIKITC